MKKIFCYIGIHNWQLKKEKHKCINHPNGREHVRVLVRECKFCGHREHYLLPRLNKKSNNWINWDFIKKEDTVNYTQL